MSDPAIDRKIILLRAAYDMLRKCADSHYVLSPMETTVYYDEADCDGTCLMEDIASELELPDRESPLAKPATRTYKKGPKP